MVFLEQEEKSVYTFSALSGLDCASILRLVIPTHDRARTEIPA
jgi:hypothetical protein